MRGLLYMALTTVKSKTVYEAVSSIAIHQPDKIAIDWGNKTITYAGLEQQSNRIANFLVEKTGNQRNIGVMLESSITLVTAILGIFKSGTVYAPIDPQFPDTRTKYMLSKIDCAWLITSSAWLDKVEQMMEGENKKINVLLTDDEVVSGKQYKNMNLFTLDKDEQIALQFAPVEGNKNSYLIFTSGSTGNPKAILGRHRSLKHFIDWEIKEFGVDGSFRISLLTSPSFDPFFRDVFVPLCAGATLCIPENRDVVMDPPKLKEWLEQKQIYLMHIVPTLFKALVSEIEDARNLKDLRYVMIAGEMLRGSDIKRFIELLGGRIQLVNMYGPTETTLAKFYYRVKEEDARRITIPVGQPIADTQVMILNSEMQICPDGNVGDIYIRTPYISSGYYNDRELTSTVFIRNPYTNNPQDIIYKTGDIGKMMPGGFLDLVGRADHQVKIRGFRIESEEIESVLLELDEIKEAIVAVKEDSNGDKILCAYIIASKELIVSELREYLSGKLPDYMIPAHFVQLEKYPLTPNGKIDRKSIPIPQAVMNIGVEYKAPENEVEQKLVRIWEQVLSLQDIGTNYNFFEIGGNSINSLKVISEIQKEFDVNVSLGELFANPTIAALANSIQTESLFSKMECVVRMNKISSEKRNVFILHSLDGTIFGYKELAQRLDKECNFYAIQARGLIGDSPLPQSLEDLVSFYMHEIKQVQPEGPYIIGGHCFGIMFAYDLVRMLEEQGETVEKLIVIDEQPWLNDKQLAYVWARSLLSRPYKAVKRSIIKASRKSPNNWTYDFYLKQTKNNSSTYPKREVLENFKYLEKTKYRIRSKINCDIYAIRASDSVWVRFTEAYWGRMTRGKVSIVDIQGDHWNLFGDPYLPGLVEAFQKTLREHDGESSFKSNTNKNISTSV